VQTLAPLQQLVHALILTELKKNVHILAIFKEMLELTDIGVLDTPVDLDLTHELLLGTTLRQARLINKLGCVHESSLGINEFVNLCETTFSKELAFDVLADANFSIFLLEFFFDEVLAGGGLWSVRARLCW